MSGATMTGDDVTEDDVTEDDRDVLVEQDVPLEGVESAPSGDGSSGGGAGEPDVLEDAASDGRPTRFLRSTAAAFSWPARLSPRARRLVIGVLAVVIVGAAGSLGYAWFEADSLASDAAAGQSALDAAESGIPEILSYDYRSVDKDLPAAANAMLSGDFRDEYAELGSSVIQPTAKKDRIVTKAEVVESSVVSSDSDGATLLLFVNQTTTSAEMEGPRLDGSRIRVEMVRDGQDWKISGFTPV
ncbi:hypothetical protein [Gordonia shandongensis]|uniref:hypothetical protein n=1 Tax=Gordonia shandongensis TaxID=376351 RepID=UPI00040764EE|nr:hypothetical protein [Gordonia shandongensis]